MKFFPSTQAVIMIYLKRHARTILPFSWVCFLSFFALALVAAPANGLTYRFTADVIESDNGTAYAPYTNPNNWDQPSPPLPPYPTIGNTALFDEPIGLFPIVRGATGLVASLQVVSGPQGAVAPVFDLDGNGYTAITTTVSNGIPGDSLGALLAIGNGTFSSPAAVVLEGRDGARLFLGEPPLQPDLYGAGALDFFTNTLSIGVNSIASVWGQTDAVINQVFGNSPGATLEVLEKGVLTASDVNLANGASMLVRGGLMTVVGEFETDQSHLIIDGSDPEFANFRIGALELLGVSPATAVTDRIIVGEHQFGQLSIRRGREFDLSGSVVIGDQADGNGRLEVYTVDDDFNDTTSKSHLMVGGGMTIGKSGGGLLDVSNAGDATIAANLTLGRDAGALGSVNVAFCDSCGGSSTLDVSGPVVVGRAGEGRLRVFNGGTISAPSMNVAVLPGSEAEMEIGVGLTARLDVAGNLAIGGDFETAGGQADVFVLGGSVHAENLKLHGGANVDVVAGSVSVVGDTVLEAGGSLSVSLLGRFESDTITDNSPDQTGVVFAGGRLGMRTYNGDLTQTAGVLSLDGETTMTRITGDYDMAGGELEIEIGPEGFDSLLIGDQANLAGDLEVNFTPGYSPLGAAVFPILNAQDGLSGAFDDLDLPLPPPGFSWGIAYTPNSVVLTLAGPLAGDYNDDGLVDAIDYAVWRNSLGDTGPLLAADGDFDGDVDDRDFDIWFANFGSQFAEATTSSAPEPAGFALAAIGVLAVGQLRRR